MSRLEKFKNEYSEHAELIEAVYEQLGSDGEDEFFTTLEDVLVPYGCGANAGFHGFIYYTDTVKFWFYNRDEIKKLMTSECETFGEASVIDMVSNFNGLKDCSADEIGIALYDSREHDNLTHIYDTFAKYALEEVAVFAESFMENYIDEDE